MHGFHNGAKLIVKTDFCIYLAFLLLFVPLKWILAWIIAALFHELCHYAVIHLFKYKICEITMSMSGVVMATESMLPSHEFICALSGPCGSFLLIGFARWIPTVALCACIQGFYNLLPIYPLDGGRAMKCIISVIFPDGIAYCIIKFAETVLLSAILVLAVYSAFHYNLGFMPILVITSVLLKIKNIKFPCKQGRLKVQ